MAPYSTLHTMFPSDAEHNSDLSSYAQYTPPSWVASAVCTHPSVIVTQFTILQPICDWRRKLETGSRLTTGAFTPPTRMYFSWFDESGLNPFNMRCKNAISGAPNIRGSSQFPNLPINIGITKKIIIKAWAVTTVLYNWSFVNVEPGWDNSIRIIILIAVPIDPAQTRIITFIYTVSQIKGGNFSFRHNFYSCC